MSDYFKIIFDVSIFFYQKNDGKYALFQKRVVIFSKLIL
jgi:hypothetical protein